MAKSWWYWIYKGPTRNSKHRAGAAYEAPGGWDDTGLMESDLQGLFSELVEMAHPALTDSEILACFKKAYKDVVRE